MVAGEIHFTLNSDPVGQGRVRFTKTGHAYTPTKTRNFHAIIKLAAQTAMREQSCDILDGPVVLSVAAYLIIPRSKSRKWQAQARQGLVRPTVKPDLSNILKAVEDGLNGTAFLDDKQIVEVRVRKFYADSPRLEVVVTPCGSIKTTVS